MSITDELREYVGNFYLFRYKDVRERLNEIADRIDIAHKHAIGYVDDRDPETMAENGWVRLPLDADGVPIHVGERVQIIGNDLSAVSHMSLADDGWRVYVKYDGGLGTGSGQPSRIRHHHAPTVEDVLEELLREYDRDDSELTNGEIIERFAAKLRLAEGEDE